MGIVTKLTGVGLYEPTRSYSFEFIKRKTNKTIAECFLLLPPTEYSLQQGFRVTETKTANGAWVDDFGNDFKQIKIHWDIYFYYLSEPSKAPTDSGFGKFIGGIANDLAGVAKGALSTIGLYDMLSGLDEFFRLRYMLSEGRDLSLLTGQNLEHPKASDFKSLGRFKRTEIDKILEESISSKLNYQDVKVIYHDYDDMNHHEVLIKDFRFNRSARDPWSFTLDVDLVALKPVYGIGNVAGDIEKFGDPSDIFKGILNSIKKLTGIVDKTLTGILNVVSIVGAFTSFMQNIELTLSTFVNKQQIKIENFKNQIKELKKYFGWNPETADVNTSVLASIPYNTAANYADYLNGDETIPESQTLQNYYLLLTEFLKMESYAMVLSWYDDYQISSPDSTDNVNKGELINPQLKNYPLYRVRYGDTLGNIANKYFGDYTYSQVIAQLNNITFADFENNGMVNKIIKLPIDNNVSIDFFRKNQVINWKKNDFFKTIYEKQLTFIGIDLKLLNKGLVIDDTGDLDLDTGLKCWMSNIEDRINTIEGNLNELNPGYGLPPLAGNLISSVLIEKFKQNITEQVKKDPRTKSVLIQDMNLNGDQLSAELSITSVLDDEMIQNFNTQLGVL